MRCRLRAPGACVCAGQGTVPGWMPQHNVQRDLALRASVAQRFRRWECTACRRGPALTGRSVALYHKMHTGAATTFRRVDEASAPAPCCRDRHAVWHPGGSSECRAEDKARRLPHKQQRRRQRSDDDRKATALQDPGPLTPCRHRGGGGDGPGVGAGPARHEVAAGRRHSDAGCRARGL